ncbi:hypothetical protein [Mariniflexile sp.]|uniref:hypothetical protein n=1 Tax=Mariniflexile sp. TaxID=1979402 RepID=UPI004047BB12
MKNTILLIALTLISTIGYPSYAQTNSKKEMMAEKTFIKHADDALTIMQKAAADMEVQGVAMVFYIPGESTQSWISKMKVAGMLTNEKANFLAIASSKAAEMAETFKNSGDKTREPKKGELGYIGGVIKKVGSGYLLATFSGATGQQDAEISTKGLEHLSKFY